MFGSLDCRGHARCAAEHGRRQLKVVRGRARDSWGSAWSRVSRPSKREKPKHKMMKTGHLMELGSDSSPISQY